MSAEKRTVTHDEFTAELKAQGVPRDHVAVVCVMCDTVQSVASLTRAGATRDRAERMFAFACVGRLSSDPAPWGKTKGRGVGCDWSLGGLFNVSSYYVRLTDTDTSPAFPPATPEQARELMLRNLPTTTTHVEPES